MTVTTQPHAAPHIITSPTVSQTRFRVIEIVLMQSFEFKSSKGQFIASPLERCKILRFETANENFCEITEMAAFS